MKNKTNPKPTQHKNHNYPFTPTITTIAVPLLIGQRKKTEATQEKTLKQNTKPKGLAVVKYEVSDDKVKFFAAKGFLKKRWVIIKEIPLNGITSIESLGNELNLTWNGAVYSFVFKQKSESFDALRNQIQGLLAEQQKTVESTEKTSLKKNDLAQTVKASIGIVDLSFDILMGLHEKRVNWTRLESYADSLGSTLNFKGQTMTPLNLEFAKVSAAIKRQVPKETSKEAYNILKSIYEYFNSLKPDNDLTDTNLNAQNVKAVISAYYMLNDLLFGKVIGEKDNKKESLALESVLLTLANESIVKVNVEELNAGMDRLGVDVDSKGVIGETREIFKKHLNGLDLIGDIPKQYIESYYTRF